MSEPSSPPLVSRDGHLQPKPPSLSRTERVALVRADQALRWGRGERVLVEAYLEQAPALASDTDAVLDLIYAEVLLRERHGEAAPVKDYLRRFPGHSAALHRQFKLHQALAAGTLSPLGEAMAGGLVAGPPPSAEALCGTDTLPTSPPGSCGVAPPLALGAPDAPAEAGLAVPGYEVLGELGRGGMGVVYQARQVVLNRVVALKMILHAEHAGRAERQRFKVEAEAVARLQHPNVVQVYEVGEHNGLPFFSLEYCGGGSLADQLDGKPLSDAEAARLVETLARAMHTAHERGVVHRDLKPANVLLTQDGTPKITDFGLAKRLDGAAGQTASGAILGTPSYMAPEQASGKVKQIGPAADVYALGAILYELLTGRPPFKGATALDAVLQVLEREPERPRLYNRRVDRSLEAICLKCLEKLPCDRYPSAEALAEDLAAYLQGAPVLADASRNLRLVRLLRRKSRYTEVLTRWGRVWMWHAGQVFLLFLATNILFWSKVEQAGPYFALWGAGLASLLMPIWLFRFRGRMRLVPVERQLAQVWGMFAVTGILTGLTGHVMGLEVFKLLPLLVLECGFAFGCMAAILGGSFYGMAGCCTVLALVLVWEPRVGPSVFGTVFAVGLFLPGWKYARLSRHTKPGGDRPPET